VPERVYAFAALNVILSYIRYVLAFRTELLQANEFWYVFVCRIRMFRILRRFEIVKYVQHTVAGSRYVHQWTHKAKMAGLFVLFTCSIDPFVTFVRILGDQSATRISTLTKITRALPSTRCFIFMVIKACLTPKVSVAQLARNSRPRVFTSKNYHTVVSCLFASV